MKRITRQSLTMLFAAPAVAIGIFATVAPSDARAAVGDAGCSATAMPQTQAAASRPNIMTRAGQVGALTAKAPGTPMNNAGCSAVSH